MSYYLNILPKTQKDENRFYILQRTVIRLGVLCAGLIFIESALLLPSYFLTVFQKDEILKLLSYEEKNPVRQHATEIQAKIVISESEISKLRGALLTTQFISSILPTLLAAAPMGIHLAHADFDKNTSTFNFSGKALKRSDILEFQKQLKAIPFVENVVSPLSNIIRESDIDFAIKVIIKA